MLGGRYHKPARQQMSTNNDD